MNLETTLLNQLKARQQQFALEALTRPQARDAFEYGFRSGVVAGLAAAEEILINLIKEEKHGNKDL
jgi:hypothetical protein